MKVVINNCYGGFGLSSKAMYEYAKRKGITLHRYCTRADNPEIVERLSETAGEAFWFGYYVTKDFGDTLDRETFWKTAGDCIFNPSDIDRDDPDLVAVVELLQGEAGDDCSSLKVVEIPDDVDYEIEEYDGNEWVAEKHRTWS